MKNTSAQILLTCLVLLTMTMSCKSTENKIDTIDPTPISKDTLIAKIVSVNHSGDSGNYNFKVGIASPDTGCDQYANWWEVITLDGQLIYRRVLGHSHVSEQPFVRSGGGVAIALDDVVIVRAHMHPSGYGTQVFKGSVKNGFTTFDTHENFALTLETQEPLPSDCAF